MAEGYTSSQLEAGQQAGNPEGYAYDQQGNVYQIDPKTGQKVQVASGFDNSGAQAQPAPQAQQAQQPAQASPQVSQTVGQGTSGQNTGQGVMSGAQSGASIGSVGGPWGAAIGGVVGGVMGGVTADEKESETQKAADESAKRKIQTQRAMYENRGGNEVIGSIAKYPNNPILAAADARAVKGEELTPEEKAAISHGGYTTVSQGAAREGVIYDNELKKIQMQQKFQKAFGMAMVPVGLAIGINLLRK